VPAAQRGRTDQIFALTDALCAEALDDECAELCRRLAARLARKRPTPLAGGRPGTWAAGVAYVIARANFLFDASQPLYLSADTIADAFGVAKSTAAAKATRIEQTLALKPFEPELVRQEIAEAHPLVWLVAVDGLVVDARHLPVALQREAHRQGLIPFVPGDASPAAA
jgi:hypothetical protein